jgi:nucleoside-diphosphate-sugar epimerase
MERLLIVGHGDIAQRVRGILPAGVEVRAIGRRLGADLERPVTLTPFAGWADAVLHCAPPPPAGEGDPRTANLLAAIERGAIIPARLVYLSTSGVYGDCGGAFVDETRLVNPQTARAERRVAAERQLGEWCTARRVALVVLRVPGIYAADRLPVERLRAGTPVLRDEDDVYTNHIHADDLAAICLRALDESAPAGVYNASDDSRLKMSEWFDLLADRAGLPRPPRVARAAVDGRISSEMLSYMGESRRLVNAKMKRDLGVKLEYPTVFEGVPRTAVAVA